jgi:hypothetical protein
MTHKAALQSIARMQLNESTDYRQLAALCVAVAATALQAKVNKDEMSKNAQDVKRAESAIGVLQRFIANPSFLPHERRHPEGCSLVITRAQEELDRLQSIKDNPEALRAIYRRNEKK